MKDQQRVRAEIDDLPAGWFVLHATDSGEFGDPGHRPDHVAIGPPGVFVIYVDHQAGATVWVSDSKLTIDGRDSDRLRQARFEARRSSGALTDAVGCAVTVQSVLVLIGAATVQTMSCAAEVHVRTQHDLRDWLCRQPQRLEPDAIRLVFDRVRPPESSACAPPPVLLD
ncbi:MAG: nuclease-related domain-containing protein [Ilumatobacteraceae bacterium]